MTWWGWCLAGVLLAVVVAVILGRDRATPDPGEVQRAAEIVSRDQEIAQLKTEIARRDVKAARDSVALDSARARGVQIAPESRRNAEEASRRARVASDSLRVTLSDSQVAMLDTIIASHARELLEVRREVTALTIERDQARILDATRVEQIASRDSVINGHESQETLLKEQVAYWQEEANPGLLTRIKRGIASHVTAAAIGGIITAVVVR